MAVLTPQPKMQFTTAAGVPLSGGKVYTYIAGTTTPQATFTDYTGATPNTNPVILNSRGEANIWLGAALYKFKLTDANDVEIWTVDYISAPTSGISPVLSGNVVIDSDTPGAALKITQTGTGSVLRVQDSTDPDTTPFIIDNAGNVGIGTATPTAQLEATGAAKIGSMTLTSSPLPITSGGTGATTATDARTNLAAASTGAITASGLTMASARLLGRTTAGSGAVEEISVGTSLSLGGGALAVTSGDFQFNSGYGSVATAYGCRAWVNFNGTGTVAIRGSGNVSSITDNGPGDYTLNFTTAMPDVNYTAATTYNLFEVSGGSNSTLQVQSTTYSTSALRVRAWAGTAGASSDCSICCVAVFR